LEHRGGWWGQRLWVEISQETVGKTHKKGIEYFPLSSFVTTKIIKQHEMKLKKEKCDP
jgi:hypothetical protein